MIATKRHDQPPQTGNSRSGVRPGLVSRVGVIGAVLFATIFVLAAGCTNMEVNLDSDDDRPVETRDDSFVVGSSSRLVVNGFNGSIVVNAGPANTIRVQATLKKADKVDYQVTQDGDTVSVEAKQKGSTTGRSPGAEIEVTAPLSTRVELRTSNGMIELRGMEESGTLRTSNGKIVVENVRGSLDARTSNGAINVSALEGSVNLQTSNGPINFDGDLTPGGENEMEASNGSVNVVLRGTPSVRLDAATTNGTVTSKLPIMATATGDNHLAGTIGDGDAGLFIRTSNGPITVQQ